MNALQVMWLNLRQKFQALPANDKRALLIMFGAIALTVLYFSLTSSRQYQKVSIQRFQDQYDNVRWIQLNLDTLSKLGNAPVQSTANAAAGNDNSLINQATTLAKPFGIVFKRFQPEGETGLRLWIEAAEFDQLLRWIAALDSQHIIIDQLDVDKLDKQVGMVDARVLLTIKP